MTERKIWLNFDLHCGDTGRKGRNEDDRKSLLPFQVWHEKSVYQGF